MLNLRQELLKTCFVRYDGTHSAGDLANNLIDMRRLAEAPHLKNYVIRQLGSLAVVKSVDFIAAVPEGANWIAQEVADSYDIPFVQLHKYPDTKEIDFYTEDDLLLAQLSSQGLLIEDVARTFYNTQKCLDLPPLDEKIVVAAAVFDRGNPANRQSLLVEYHALAHQHIPSMLPENSELWAYADEKE